MIKIAVLSTDISAKKIFCNKLVKEFDERGKKSIILTQTTLESPFKDSIDYYNEDALWVWCRCALNELEAAIKHDAVIVQCCVLEPFFYAASNDYCGPNLDLYRIAANEWAESYDTIVWLKNSKLLQMQDYDITQEFRIEMMYANWITERLDRLPITVKDSQEVFEDKKWLI
jgi:hypothetical protein